MDRGGEWRGESMKEPGTKTNKKGVGEGWGGGEETQRERVFLLLLLLLILVIIYYLQGAFELARWN